MPIQERTRDYSTLNQTAEIQPLQRPQEVDLAPNVGRNSRLKGTGFDLALEMGRLIKNYNQNVLAGKDSLEALMLSASELEVNIRTFIVEYIQTNTILPHVNRLKEVEGVVRMVGQNGVPVVDGITSAERYGAVLQASKKVENYLTTEGLQRSTNRVAVINNPLGHSGLIDKNGQIINYKSNQTMVFWTDKQGDLHGLTIVSDLNQKQSKQLSVGLGVKKELLTGETVEKEIANIVAHPAFFSYADALQNPAKYVFEKILAIRGNSDIRLEQADGAVEYRSVARTWQDIDRYDSLLQFSSVWEECLKQFRETIILNSNNLNDPTVQTKIASIIEKTILDITVDYLQQAQPTSTVYSSDNSVYEIQDNGIRLNSQIEADNYAKAAVFLQSRDGCNGGGGTGRTSLRGISLGSSEVTSVGSSLESDQYGPLEFECPNPKCRKINRRPRGQLIPNCQHCNADVRC